MLKTQHKYIQSDAQVSAQIQVTN